MFKKVISCAFGIKGCKKSKYDLRHPPKKFVTTIQCGYQKKEKIDADFESVEKVGGKNDWEKVRGFTTFAHGKKDEKQQNSFLICKSFSCRNFLQLYSTTGLEASVKFSVL
jgi:hypothetical protein